MTYVELGMLPRATRLRISRLFVSSTIALVVAAGCGNDSPGGAPWDHEVDGRAPKCEPISICEDGECRLEVESPETAEQTFEIDVSEVPESVRDADALYAVPAPVEGSSTPKVRGKAKVLLEWDDPEAETPSIRTGTAHLVPGEYELVWETHGWEHRVPDEHFHERSNSTRRTVTVPTDEPVTMTPEVPSPSVVEGDIQYDGKRLDERWPQEDISDLYGDPHADFAGGHWTVTFRDPETGEEVASTSGSFDEHRYEMELFPMRYDVEFSLKLLAVAPDQQLLERAVEGPVVIEDDIDFSDDRTVDIDLETARLRGDLDVEGARPLLEEEPSDIAWTLLFHAPQTGESFSQRLDGGDDYEARVYPGTYDIYLAQGQKVERDADPLDLRSGPLDHPLPAATDVTIEGETQLDIDVETASVEVEPRWNGEPAADRLSDDEIGAIIFKRMDLDRRMQSYSKKFGADDGPNLAIDALPPGRYEVHGHVPTPPNGRARTRLASDVDLAAGKTNRVEIAEFDTVDVSVSGTFAGIEPGSEPEHRTRIYFYGLEPPRYRSRSGQVMRRERLRWKEAGGTLLRGRYDVSVERGREIDYDRKGRVRGGFPDPPHQQDDVLVADDWKAEPNSDIRLDVATVPISGEADWRGETIPSVEQIGYEYDGPTWGLEFHSRTTDEIFRRDFHGASKSWEAEMYPGVYDVYLSFNLPGLFPDQPGGQRVRVAECVGIR